MECLYELQITGESFEMNPYTNRDVYMNIQINIHYYKLYNIFTVIGKTNESRYITF